MGALPAPTAGLAHAALGLTTSAGCSACSAGTYSSATGAAQVCTPPSTSWLFKSPLTADYYLTLTAWINPNTPIIFSNCHVVCDGNCGGSTFIGVLSVINTTQFQNDVNM